MEGNDNNTILKKSIKIDIPFTKSYRLKMVMFGTMLLVYSIIFSMLFGKISINLSDNMQKITKKQSDYFSGYSSISTMSLSLSDYLNIYDESSLDLYENSKDDVLHFIEFLEKESSGPYLHDLAKMCKNYVASADEAIEHRENSEDALMIASYNQSQEIYDLISMYSTYSFEEFQNSISNQLVLLNENMYHQLNVIIPVLMIVTIVIMIISVVFLRYLLSPINNLITIVEKVSNEFWEIQPIPKVRNDETGLLVRAFYEMLNRIRQQFDELVYKQKLEKELQEEREKSIKSEALLAKSELKVFQSQINSHFLFNTLNTISRLAFIEHAPRVQRATNLLAQFLRNILTQFNRIVTMADEFANVDSYVQILRFRFGNRIQFEADIDSDLEWAEIPSMTIQPLVENAVKHGFAHKTKGYIKYATEKSDDNYFMIYVWDDGKGILPEQRDEIISRLKNDDMDENISDGIGLLNIYHRLNLAYPKKVTPIIESEYNKFTKVGFKIKYRDENQN